MTTLTLRLPDSLFDAVQELARKEGLSIDQFVTSAVAEKMAALMSDYPEERARRGSRAKYEAAPAQVPDVEPDDHDRDGEMTARLDRLYAEEGSSLDPALRRVQRQSIGSETNDWETPGK